MAGSAKSRSKRSKVEVQEEFQTLVEEASTAKETACAKSELSRQMNEADIRKAVSEISVEALTQKIAELNFEVSHSLSNISEKMISEVQLLTQLREAVSLESKELSKLHGVDIAATSIDQLIKDHETKKQMFEEEVQQVKKQWELEQSQHAMEEIEYEKNLKKNRQRENEEYEYVKHLERKKVQDKYEEECYQRQKQNQEKQENLEKNWELRETSLKEKEEQLQKLQKEVEEFPKKLFQENAKAAENALKQAETKWLQEISSLKKDLLVEKQMSELKITNQQGTIQTLQQQIQALQAQLEEAKKQVQDIAVKAIEGASGAKALSHINQIAIEQAKNRQGQP